MKQLSDFLGNKRFLTGDAVTIADFSFYDAIKWHVLLCEEMVTKYKNIIEYVSKIEAMPKIKSFMESDKYFKGVMTAASSWRPQCC